MSEHGRSLQLPSSPNSTSQDDKAFLRVCSSVSQTDHGTDHHRYCLDKKDERENKVENVQSFIERLFFEIE
jgi:hypothetical protein